MSLSLKGGLAIVITSKIVVTSESMERLSEDLCEEFLNIPDNGNDPVGVDYQYLYY